MLVSLLAAAGWVWLALNIIDQGHGAVPGLCLIKETTGFPCPSCGTTRAVLLLTQGEIVASMQKNPNGMIAAITLILLPVMLVFDMVSGKQTVPAVYAMLEAFFQRRRAQLAGAALVLANWWWNIQKGL